MNILNSLFILIWIKIHNFTIMKNFPNTKPSIDDFSDKCRICLNNYSDMIDIFASGISDQVMEVINIKVFFKFCFPLYN